MGGIRVERQRYRRWGGEVKEEEEVWRFPRPLHPAASRADEERYYTRQAEPGGDGGARTKGGVFIDRSRKSDDLKVFAINSQVQNNYSLYKAVWTRLYHRIFFQTPCTFFSDSLKAIKPFI